MLIIAFRGLGPLGNSIKGNTLWQLLVSLWCDGLARKKYKDFFRMKRVWKRHYGT